MKIKKFISLLAAAAMAVTALTGAMTASASEVANGTCGDLTWTLDSDGVLTISGNGKMDSPSVEVGTEPSDFLSTYSYKEYKENIKEVIIKEGVTSIGFCAFYKLPNLETVVLPSTITEYNSVKETENTGYMCYAFAECPLLKNLTLTEGMTAIGGRAFYNCESLDSVRIPSTLLIPTNESGDHDSYGRNGWGLNTFEGCSSLKNITLPEGLTTIGAVAFKNTAVESVVIPSTIQFWCKYPVLNVGAVENNAFEGCEKLSSVTFTEGLKSINGVLFLDCPLLKKVVIPKSVIDISYGFSGRANESTALEEVAFEDGSQLTEIGISAFENCGNLKMLEIPENAINIQNGCFLNCSSVKTVYLYSRTLDAYSLPDNAMIFAYPDSVANSQKSCVNIETAITSALNDLKTAVKEAEKYSEEDYTTASYGVLKALLEKAATKSEESHILGMKYLTEDIYEAIEGLRDKSEEPSSDPSSSDPSDSSNPTDNSSDPSNSSDNNNQSQSPNTPAIPSTSAPTTATPKPVTPPTVTTTAAKPAKVKNVKVTAKKKKLNVSWKKVSGATGYEVQYATNNKFTKNKKTVTVKKNNVTLKKLKPKKKYFVKVRAYKKANGNTYYGKWSKVIKKKVK